MSQQVDLLSFIEASPSPWHAVESLKKLHEGAVLAEEKGWQLEYGKNYGVDRLGSSWAAWKMPEAKIDLEKLRFHIVAAHTDSPGLKLKPQSPKQVENYHQWGVEIYGGTLYNTWLDRDLGIAGMVHWLDGDAVKTKLICDKECKIRVPQLAIHLDRDVNNQGLKLNPHKELMPILGLQQGKKFQDWIGNQVGVSKETQLHFDLWLFDTQAPAVGGLNEEFIYSARLDNLAMCHAGAVSLSNARAGANMIPLFCSFHHEEVGSVSTQGADSNFLPSLLERTCLQLGMNREQYLACLRRSYLISADMAHALHPNYQDRHDGVHQPLMGRGPVIKGNANLRYAGSAATHVRFDQWCQKAGISFQNFVNRADLGCGSTIGPSIASNLGIDTIDVGNPMLSMHSAREMAALSDHEAMMKVMTTFYEDTPS
jgi:aspartyl aminopeptidase